MNIKIFIGKVNKYKTLNEKLEHIERGVTTSALGLSALMFILTAMIISTNLASHGFIFLSDVVFYSFSFVSIVFILLAFKENIKITRGE